jgi:hypothetical protein
MRPRTSLGSDAEGTCSGDLPIDGQLYVGKGVYVAEDDLIMILAISTLAELDFVDSLPRPVENLASQPKTIVVATSATYFTSDTPRTLMRRSTSLARLCSGRPRANAGPLAGQHTDQANWLFETRRLHESI